MFSVKVDLWELMKILMRSLSFMAQALLNLNQFMPVWKGLTFAFLVWDSDAGLTTLPMM